MNELIAASVLMYFASVVVASRWFYRNYFEKEYSDAHIPSLLFGLVWPVILAIEAINFLAKLLIAKGNKP